jgi:DDE_Tnp_1-associated
MRDFEGGLDIRPPSHRAQGDGVRLDGFGACFAELKDPRPSGSRRHDLLDVMMIALCAILSGGRTAVDMAVFAEAKRDFLGRFLRLRNGAPSHDTFSRLLSRLDPDQFRACFQKFVARFGDTCSDVIAIDGKTLRRPSDPHRAGSALHMISAWSCEKRLVLAQIAADHKSRESAAVLELLKFLSLRGTTVTTDALNRRRGIVRQIVQKGGTTRRRSRAITAQSTPMSVCCLKIRDGREARSIQPRTATMAESRRAPAWSAPK